RFAELLVVEVPFHLLHSNCKLREISSLFCHSIHRLFRRPAHHIFQHAAEFIISPRHCICRKSAYSRQTCQSAQTAGSPGVFLSSSPSSVSHTSPLCPGHPEPFSGV